MTLRREFKAMSNPNERETYNQEVRKESYTDTTGRHHTHLERNTATDNNSYQNAYANGRYTERRYQQANLAERDNENTASALLMGILFTSLVGLTIGAFWYSNQRNATIDNTTPVETPIPTNANPTPSLSPQPQTTIIERTREVPVVIPQPQATATSAPVSPQINVTVPPQESTPGRSPAVTPNNQQPSQSNTPNLENRNDTSTGSPATSTPANPSSSTSPESIEQPQGESNSSSN
jgi:hypothetical protein